MDKLTNILKNKLKYYKLRYYVLKFKKDTEFEKHIAKLKAMKDFNKRQQL